VNYPQFQQMVLIGVANLAHIVKIGPSQQHIVFGDNISGRRTTPEMAVQM
jgi:hypothetical protein